MNDMYFEMVEIYSGKDPQWAGWHNLLLRIGSNPGDSKSIAGPLDPETSLEIKAALNLTIEHKD